MTETKILLTDLDIHLFKEGRHFRLYEKMGAHILPEGGTHFAVWAPNARAVAVVGNFNHWNKDEHPLQVRSDGSGIWEGYLPKVGHGEAYKYAILNAENHWEERADPFASFYETPPNTASIVWNTDYKWKDEDYWKKKAENNTDSAQSMSVYELHLASWQQVPEEGNRSLSYSELADRLVSYLVEMEFTHVEFLPVMEHPFGGSWGYQSTGYFAPTSRFGTPQEFAFLVDKLHEAGIGVILDWVPSHFPGDTHALYKFDGTHLFEHADPRQGFHPDWNSYIFNYGRNEVRSFLISSAMCWLDRYHADGLRVDAVASMLYLDYSRKADEWIPNRHGGNENLEAIQFMQELNVAVYENFPQAYTIAEESTSWPGVSRPTYAGGLGFGQKWMMGWMHDSLQYFQREPVHRSYHQGEIMNSLSYAFSENFMLPLSHDEVVHGKGSLIGKMPGDEWQKFANLRLLLGWQWMHPGTKLLFMGGEFGQIREWNHNISLDWHLLHYPSHKGVLSWVKALNFTYKNEPALYELPFSPDGFKWIDTQDTQNSVLIFERKGASGESLIVACNFTPQVLSKYRLGVPKPGKWQEILNSDDQDFGGSGVLNSAHIKTQKIAFHTCEQSIELTLPPLGISVLKKVQK